MSEEDNSVQYRRMSLKDFTGLESHTPQTKVVTLKEFTGLEDYAAQSLSSILENPPLERQSPVFIPGTMESSAQEERPENTSEGSIFAPDNHPVPPIPAVPATPATPTNSSSTSPSTSLIDSYSIRRRSMIGSSDTDGGNQMERADIGPSNTLFEELSHTEVVDRLNEMRTRLARTIRNLPNESPKKKQNCAIDKSKLLDATRCLNGACKAMVQAACEGKGKKKAEVMNEVIECADKITSITEKLIIKSDSIFEAELASAKTDQMLKSLEETVTCLEKAEESDGNIESESINELLAKNTALSANISQLLESFYRKPS